jgi:hypothetical protein
MKSTIPVLTAAAILMATVIGTGYGTSTPEKEEHSQIGASHASIQAYPQAVVTLKEPKSGMLFYVESNGRRLVAFEKDGNVAWSVDVLAEAKVKPARGAPVIRDLKLIDGALSVTCGRSDYARVQPKTGKTEYLGND